MLSGKLVRVRHSRNRIIPQYIDVTNPLWRDVGERLLALYRSLSGCSRAELEEEIKEAIGENPTQLVHQGIAKILEDRCEFEVAADHPPEEIREQVFLTAACQRRLGATFDRLAVINEVARTLNLSNEQVDQGLFADLKAEQRLIRFEDMTVEQLLHRYNVALAQAVVLRSTRLSVSIMGESPTRYRQLCRALKFHRLICDFARAGPDSYTLRLDGPLSLFSATQKYGLQLASFLPWVLQCRRFELVAEVRWGAQRKEKEFLLSSTDGLRSHVPDYGSYIPKELSQFAESFQKNVGEWTIAPETELIQLTDGLWVPDFKLTHRATGNHVFLEILGFWRRTDAEKTYQRLRRELPGRFVLAVSEQFNTDESAEGELPRGVYRFKRTPLPDEVARRAGEQMGGN
jgi:predicted nuclease of restriction endonuclease-like RecB superfamily